MNFAYLTYTQHQLLANMQKTACHTAHCGMNTKSTTKYQCSALVVAIQFICFKLKTFNHNVLGNGLCEVVAALDRIDNVLNWKQSYDRFTWQNEIERELEERENFVRF